MAVLRRHVWLGWLLLLVTTADSAPEAPPAAGATAAPGEETARTALPSAEYQLKAVFLFNFAQFVDWPSAAFADRRAPLVVATLGDDPFGQYLDDLVRGERIEGRPMEVRRFRRVEEIDACHLLFIGASEDARLEAIFRGLKGRKVLTVGESWTFSRQGGMVRFVMEKGKISLHINVDASREAGLIISSKILRQSTLVKSNRGMP